MMFDENGMVQINSSCFKIYENIQLRFLFVSWPCIFYWAYLVENFNLTQHNDY